MIEQTILTDEMISTAVNKAVALIKADSRDSQFSGGKAPPSPLMASSYITTNNAMRATSASLALVSAVLSFDIVELWTEEVDGQFRCIFVHVEPDFLSARPRPSVISGYYPTHKREHKISPNICLLTKHSSEKFHWRTNESGSGEALELKKAIESDDGKYSDLDDIKTELCYQLDSKTEKASVYIVAFATDKIDYKPAKDETNEGNESNDVEQLDVKNKYVPRSLSTAAFDPELVRQNDGECCDNYWVDGDSSIGNFSRDSSISSYKNPGDINCYEDDEPGDGSVVGKARIRHDSHDALISLEGKTMPKVDSCCSLSMLDLDSSALPPLPPVPTDHFSFPISRIPISVFIEANLSLNVFKNIVHIGDGTNSNIYRAELYNQTVVVKMIKEDIKTNPIAVHEFDVEHSMLTRLKHPNIVKILGAGKSPRRFIVLEYLTDTITNVLSKRSKQSGFSLFRKPVFTYSEILETSMQLASALYYIHETMHADATIIHRDLKPDNVGLAADGSLKLFDFGLSTCVIRRTSPLESYKMTGNTGSLRYMAPEVVLSNPYTEKVDVYSFGIILWQLASEATPFKGFTRDDFIAKVIVGNERPKIDKSWPNGFTSIIVSCWHKDPLQRPSFQDITFQLQSLIDELNRSRIQRGKSIFKNVDPGEQSERRSEKKSGWF